MTSSTIRRALALTLAAATTSTAFAAAPAEAAPGTQAPQGVSSKTAAKPKPKAKPKVKAHANRKADAGFRIIGSLRHPVVAMTSPAKGKVWLAERAPDGSVIAAEVGGKSWSATTLPIKIDKQERVHLSGSAANDLWLTAGGQLWRYDGRRWTKTSLPAGATVTTVHDVAGPDVYVGLSGDLDSTGVYRLRSGRWNSLGRPASDNERFGPANVPADITMADGQLFATWNLNSRSSGQFQNSYAYNGKAWTLLFQNYTYGAGSYRDLNAWLAPTKNQQIAFTNWWRSYEEPMPAGPGCAMWTKSGGEQQCTTRWAVGAADLLPGGRIVIGGNDFAPYQKPKVEGTFGLRTSAGVEKLVAGDPGDATLGMAVEPGTSTAWAATRRGKEILLQRWVG